MYNKCNKCGRQLENYDERKLVLDNKNNVSTRCMDCYGEYAKLKQPANL